MNIKRDIILPALKYVHDTLNDGLNPNQGFGNQFRSRPRSGSGEIAIPESSLFNRFKLFKYTPDLLMQRRGFKILERMAQDDQIGQAIEAKKTMRLSTGWNVVAAENEPNGDLHKEFIDFQVEDFIEKSFNLGLRNIMGALNLGHSINEMVFKPIEKGKFTGKIGLKALKSKNPEDINLFTDEFGNIEKDGVVSITAPDIGAMHPKDKFIIYSFRPKYEDVFGTSNYRILYDLWWLKHIFKRAWGVYGERFGVPVGVAKYPKGWKEQAQLDLFELMKAIRTETNIVIPKDVEFEFAESKGGREDFFIKSIGHIDKQMTKVVLGQTLTSDQGDKGSQSLGTVHMDILGMEIDELGVDLAETLNEQFVRHIININFPNVVEYPKFEFPSINEDDETPLVDKFIQAKEKSLIKATVEDEKHIRKLLRFPERDETTELLNPTPAVVDPNLPPQLNQDPEEGPSQGDRVPLSPAASGGASTTDENETAPPVGDQRGLTAGQAASLAEHPVITGVNRRKLTKFEEKVDFRETLRTIEIVGVEGITTDLDPILRDSLDRVIRDIKRKKIVANKDFKEARKIEIRNKSDIKNAIQTGLTRVSRRGVTSARKEKANARKMMALQDLGEFSLAKIKELLRENSFRMTGNITGQMQGMISDSLYNSLISGASEQGAIDGIIAALEPFFISGAAAVEDFTAGRLSTIVRTNVVDAMNIARKEFFLQDTEFTPAFQYSAVLDDRVRPNHATMDSRIFRASNPIWSAWTPANGFNCRCLLVPVTKFDGWDGVESQTPAVQPDKGFGAN